MSRRSQASVLYVLQTSSLNLRKIVYELLLVIIGASLLAIGARIKFLAPLTHVPFTLQTLFLHSILFTLGRKAWRCVLAYIALGLIGAPVFAFGGGFLYVLSPTFGYILGFLVGTIVAGFLIPKGSFTLKRGFTAGLVQLSIVYAIGSIWLASWYSLFRKIGFLQSITLALLTGVAPFIVWDLFKLLIALHLTKLTYVIRVLILKHVFSALGW